MCDDSVLRVRHYDENGLCVRHYDGSDFVMIII